MVCKAARGPTRVLALGRSLPAVPAPKDSNVAFLSELLELVPSSEIGSRDDKEHNFLPEFLKSSDRLPAELSWERQFTSGSPRQPAVHAVAAIAPVETIEERIKSDGTTVRKETRTWSVPQLIGAIAGLVLSTSAGVTAIILAHGAAIGHLPPAPTLYVIAGCVGGGTISVVFCSVFGKGSSRARKKRR